MTLQGNKWQILLTLARKDILGNRKIQKRCLFEIDFVSFLKQFNERDILSNSSKSTSAVLILVCTNKLITLKTGEYKSQCKAFLYSGTAENKLYRI